MRALVILLALLWASSAHAELAEGLRAYVDKIETYRAQAIKSAVQAGKDRQADKAYRRQSAERLKLAKTVHALDYADKLVAPALPKEPSVGDVGAIDGARVMQIIDGETMIVESVEVLNVGQFTPPTSSRPFPSRSATREYRSGPYVVRGVPTNGIADGADPKLPKVLIVTGTERRAGNTLLVLTPVDKEAIRKEVDAYLKQRGKKPTKPAARPR